MFDSKALKDELRALQGDVSRVLHTTAEGLLDGSKSQAEALADQIKAALSELGDAISEDEAELTRLISNRPVASLASAFALGVVVGLLLRRH
jgi:ElaB/YqjD/DUF883 family membrane-anchored ribosome-binding protein